MAATTQDAVLRGAVDLAREAAVELAERPEHVGEHLGTTVEEDRLVSHRFACTARGYRGWVWTVTLSRVPRARTATVCEAVLLPGDDAVLAPAWLPWDQRLRPGDIGPGDVLPFKADDPRLEPGWTPTGDPELDEVAIDELALARNRVLSPTGIDEAAERWYRGRQGPASAGSVASAEACMTCGFIIPLAGPLGTVFGVCANEWSPDDGKVVALEHGCGAHSETDVEPRPSEWPDPSALIDELVVDVTANAAPAPVLDGAAVAEAVEPAGAVAVEVVAEDAAVEPVAEVAVEPAVEVPAAEASAQDVEPEAAAPAAAADQVPATEDARPGPDDEAPAPQPEP
jgi:hypothetical protein